MKKDKIIYIPTQLLIEIHDNNVITKTGGLKGIKDPGRIESILTHIENDEYYPSFEEKITHLVFSLVKFHVFLDGNKRTSLAASTFFLQLNGFDHIVDEYMVEMENIILWVASGIINKPLLCECISSLLYYGELSEEIKYKLSDACASYNDFS